MSCDVTVWVCVCMHPCICLIFTSHGSLTNNRFKQTYNPRDRVRQEKAGREPTFCPAARDPLLCRTLTVGSFLLQRQTGLLFSPEFQRGWAGVFARTRVLETSPSTGSLVQGACSWKVLARATGSMTNRRPCRWEAAPPRAPACPREARGVSYKP